MEYVVAIWNGFAQVRRNITHTQTHIYIYIYIYIYKDIVGSIREKKNCTLEM